MQPGQQQPMQQPAMQQQPMQMQQQQPAPKDLTALQVCACYSLCCPCGLCTGLFCWLQNKDDPDENARNWAQYNAAAGVCNCCLSVGLNAAASGSPAAATALGAVKTALASKTATVAPAMVTMA